MSTTTAGAPLRAKVIFALWGIALGYSIFLMIQGTSTLVSWEAHGVLNVCFLSAFAIIHGIARYRTRDFIVFFIISFVTSNVFENIGILTGFPFGNYHYTDILGVKLFLVPVLIGPAYFAAGYLAWTLAQTLLGLWTTRLRGRDVFLVPMVAAFIMVAWDVCMDPISSTVQRHWIWHDGGGYFGVPLRNFAGWYLCVYTCNQIFALYVSRTDAADVAPRPAFPKTFWYPAVLMYAGLALGMPILALFGSNVPVTDQSGRTWATGDIYRSMALVSLFMAV